MPRFLSRQKKAYIRPGVVAPQAAAPSLSTSSTRPSPFHFGDGAFRSGTLDLILNRSSASAAPASGASAGAGPLGGQAALARVCGGAAARASTVLETQFTSVRGVRSSGRSEGSRCGLWVSEVARGLRRTGAGARA